MYVCMYVQKMEDMVLGTEYCFTHKQKPHIKLFLMQAEVDNDSKMVPKTKLGTF